LTTSDGAIHVAAVAIAEVGIVAFFKAGRFAITAKGFVRVRTILWAGVFRTRYLWVTELIVILDAIAA
jgi:hypothetical protein